MILGDFRDCGRAVDGWAAGLFCGEERADCLKQDFGGFSGLQANG